MSRLLNFLFYALFFFTPLIFWPRTSELFEINKMFFVYLMTGFITTTWIIKSLKEQKFTFSRTPLDLSILLFLISQILSTVFSINPHTSLWGYYSRLNGGLTSTICYIILYYAFVSNIEIKFIKSLIFSLLSSTLLVSVYAILEHFGIDKHIWVQDVQNRVFSTLGQPNWLGAFLLAVLPLPIFLVFDENNRSNGKIHAQHAHARQERVSMDFSIMKIGYIVLSVLITVSIIYTKSQSTLFATIIILPLCLISLLKRPKIPLLLLLTITLIFHRPLLNKITTFTSVFHGTLQEAVNRDNATRFGGSNSMLIRRIVWTGAMELGKKYPLFGTGVETFGYTYYWVRPVEHNLVSEWDFLYNKAHNEYLNFFANTGLLGLTSYLYLIITIIRVFLAERSKISIPLLLGFISILITNFFGFSVVAVSLLFFLYPALTIINSNNFRQIHLPLKLPQKTFSIITLILCVLWTNQVIKFFTSDLIYNEGKYYLTSGAPDQSLKKLNRAVSQNPSEPLFLSQLSEAQAQTAAIIHAQLENSLESSSSTTYSKGLKLQNEYLKKAIENSKTAIQMNPFHTNFYKAEAKNYLYLATIDPKYYSQALESLVNLSALTPTDAKTFYNIGLFNEELHNSSAAKTAFQTALKLKPDYEAAKEKLSSFAK